MEGAQETWSLARASASHTSLASQRGPPPRASVCAKSGVPGVGKSCPPKPYHPAEAPVTTKPTGKPRPTPSRDTPTSPLLQSPSVLVTNSEQQT